MKMECDVIRDLLPLYADEACSGKSRELVEEHLGEWQNDDTYHWLTCDDCGCTLVEKEKHKFKEWQKDGDKAVRFCDDVSRLRAELRALTASAKL